MLHIHMGVYGNSRVLRDGSSTIMSKKKASYLFNCGFGIVFGLLLFRLALGPAYNYPALYTHLVWIVLFPVNVLRGYSNQSIYVLFYVLFWSYALVVKTIIYNDPLGKTFLKMVIWMVVLALPFLPFGIEYFSLARYSTSISSYLLRLLPFIALLGILFLINHFFFRQNHLVAGAWTLSTFFLIIVIITLADFLPLLKSQFFFHALGYRISLANDFISNTPLIALLVFMLLAVFYVFAFDRQFLRVSHTKRSPVRVITPIGISIAMLLMLMIIRDDSRRYRYFDYGEGIATVYYAAYDDRQTLSFDEDQFTLSSRRYNAFYPFGRLNTKDTLRRHAEDILAMKIIEGLDYYRLERIVKILAHGPRDVEIYNRFKRLTEGERYRVPEQFRTWAEYLRGRYTTPDGDIVVVGWIALSGVPLGQVEFFVNKVSTAGRKVIEPIWQGKTGADGGFEFECYKKSDSDSLYFQVIFLLHDDLIGRSVDFLKVINPLPVFAQPGKYFPDTLRIAFSQHGEEPNLKHLHVQTFTTADSFSLFLPYVEQYKTIRLTGAVSSSGEMQDIVLDYDDPETDTAMLWKIERLKNSRIFLKDSAGKVEIQIN